MPHRWKRVQEERQRGMGTFKQQQWASDQNLIRGKRTAGTEDEVFSRASSVQVLKRRKKKTRGNKKDSGGRNKTPTFHTEAMTGTDRGCLEEKDRNGGRPPS